MSSRESGRIRKRESLDDGREMKKRKWDSMQLDSENISHCVVRLVDVSKMKKEDEGKVLSDSTTNFQRKASGRFTSTQPKRTAIRSTSTEKRKRTSSQNEDTNSVKQEPIPQDSTTIFQRTTSGRFASTQPKRTAIRSTTTEKRKRTSSQNEDTNSVKQEPIPQATSDDHDDDDDDDVLDIEAKRLKNIQDNAEFLAKLGMSAARIELREAVFSAKKKPTSKGYREKIEKEVLPPRTRSLRLQRIAPDGSYVPPSAPEPPLYPVDDHPRPEPQLEMRTVLKNTVEGGVHDKFLGQIADLSIKDKKISADSDSFLKKLQKLKLTEEGVTKVVPTRVFSIAIHPTNDKVLAIAGGKWGELGFWDVTSSDGQDGVFTYTPHSRPVRTVHIDPATPDRVYTCSYDGSVRCGHLQKALFTEVYATEEDDDILMNELTTLDNGNSLLIAQNNQQLAHVDIRTEKVKLYRLPAGHKSIRSVSVHPLQPQYIATGHRDGTVHIWDMRNMKVGSAANKSIWTGRHAKSVESAYFSPVTGNQLLTTSNDDFLGLFFTKELLSGQTKYSEQRFIRHNNHTGRWLSKFRATWHPSRDDCFVVGSMLRPRCIELFGTTSKALNSLSGYGIVHQFVSEDLNSVCSLNAFHPTMDILVGGNSSGRVHVFK